MKQHCEYWVDFYVLFSRSLHFLKAVMVGSFFFCLLLVYSWVWQHQSKDILASRIFPFQCLNLCRWAVQLCESTANFIKKIPILIQSFSCSITQNIKSDPKSVILHSKFLSRFFYLIIWAVSTYIHTYITYALLLNKTWKIFVWHFQAFSSLFLCLWQDAFWRPGNLAVWVLDRLKRNKSDDTTATQPCLPLTFTFWPNFRCVQCREWRVWGTWVGRFTFRISVEKLCPEAIL